jgi:hypothetical protein
MDARAMQAAGRQFPAEEHHDDVAVGSGRDFRDADHALQLHAHDV